ncbi:YDG domain-containing protein [Ferruginibacter lapsinanis]|uniref:YDG domain-containing protein n=1 Tax=Ferruginibacter lapsinanis TaxID=563172 RepID=UPI001E504AB2|nr:YDG domain-containing protein [Ferruginibacter lapsinanis]UEG49375.1 YDG domain-containing protein [Ferruginibacter lapsinanis]
MKRLYFLILTGLLLLVSRGKGQIVWANTSNASAWYTAANWSPSTASGAWLTSNIAQFANAGSATTAGINMGTASLSIGGIEITSARTRTLTIGSSSGTGSLTLSGTTINSVSNVILRNNSGYLLTLQNNETGTGKTMNIVLNNSTNNIINIDGAGGIAISSVISGASKNLTLGGAGAGILTLSGANTYTGTTTINSSSSTLTLGAAGVIADASNIILNGGTFNTGASTGYSETVGTLALTNDATIALGTGSHSLTFANSSAVSWTSGKTLTITGWTGTAGVSGTAGKIFVGVGGLTSGQLAQISFTGFPGTPIILASGEVVPPGVPPAVTTATSSPTGTVGTAVSTFNLSGVFSGGPTSYALASGSLPPGLSLNTSTGAITGTPTTAGSFSASFSASNAAGTSASNAAVNYTIAKGTQTISFGALSAATYGTTPYTFTAATNTSSSGKTITYSSATTSIADFSSNTVASITIYAVGSSVITASLAGDANWNAATANQTLTVNKKALTITGLTGVNKVYDATTTATTTGTPTLTGIVGADDVTISGSSPSYTFANKNIGTAKAITATGFTLSGTTQNNYTITQPTGLTANITAATLTVSGSVAANKVYDGTTTATISTPGTLSGIQLSDVVSVSSTGTFASATVANNIAVTLILSGTDAGNYTLTQPGITANITKASQTISIASTATKNVGDADYNPATASSGLTVTYVSSNTSVATIVGGQVHIVGAGVTTITASQAGNTNYSAAADATQTLTVSAGLATWTNTTSFVPVVTSNVTGANAATSGLSNVNAAADATYGINGNGYYTTTSLTNFDRYFEFSLTPAAFYTMTTTSVSIKANVSSGSDKAEIYYSTDPTFATSTKLNTSTLAVTTTATTTTYTAATATLPGDVADNTLYFRVYPYDASGSGIYFRVLSFGVNGYLTPITVPTILTSPKTLSGFTYAQGFGPSVAQSFTISAANLTGGGGAITISGSTDYDVSTTNATSGFGASASLTYTGTGTISPNTVWVRLKAGLTNASSPYNGETVTVSGGTATKTVTVNGSVTPAPVLTPSVSSLTGFNYIEGAGPSTAQSFTLSATDLTAGGGTITISGSANYEVSTTSATTGFGVSATRTYTGSGTISPNTVWVRLKTGLTSASSPYNGETIGISGGNATASITVNGTVSPKPDITLTSPNPSVAAAGLSQNSTNNPVYRFDLSVVTSTATLTGATITTAGTYVASNITNLKLWYSADATFSSGSDVLLSTIASPTGAGAQVFPAFSQAVNAGNTGYFYVTTDLPCGATGGNTISVNAITTADLTFTTGNKTGTAYAGGTQTFTSATPSNVTGQATSNCVNAGTTVGWTNPTGCYNTILVVASSGSFSGTTPTGNGGSYTANTVFGSGTAFDGGFVVYKGTGTSVDVTGLTNGTSYTYKIFTRNDNSWTSGVTTNCTPVISYCTALGQTADGIVNVTFNTINNTSTRTAYTDYTSTVSTTVLIGSSYTLSAKIHTGGNYTNYTKAWIDWNQDGTFSTTTEEYDLGSATNVTNGTSGITPSITVPAGAVVGTTRMRLISKYSSAATPCQGGGSTFDGEVEDYAIVVTNCSVPTKLVFQTQPVNTAQDVIVPVVVAATCSDGVVATSLNSGSVTLSVGTTGCGVSGTVTANFVNGLATFSTIKFTRSVQTGVAFTTTNTGTGYTLTNATSNSFTITSPGGTPTSAVIASEDFQAAPTLSWNYTVGTPTVVGAGGSSGSDVTTVKNYSGSKTLTKSYSVNNASGEKGTKNTVTFDNQTINTSLYDYAVFSFQLASLGGTGGGGSGDGVDNGEDMVVEISLDNGATWSTLLTEVGHSNRLIPFSTSPNTALAYNANASYSGSDTKSKFTVTLPAGTAQFKFRFSATNNRIEENWAIDNISLTGYKITAGSEVPLPTAVGSSINSCPGASNAISIATTNTIGATTYSWTPATNISNSTAANPSVYPTTSTTYVGTVTDADGCKASANVDIIVPSGTSGSWVGSLTNDWFYCGNWGNGVVPTSATTVTIDASASNPATIDPTSIYAPAGGNAYANHISISNQTLSFANGGILNVAGNLTNQTNGIIDMTNGGNIILDGSWNNTATFTSGTGTITYNGSASQTIVAEAYNNLTSTNTGTRILSPSGTIGVKSTFLPGTNTYTITGSTIDFNGVDSTQNIPAFNFYNVGYKNGGTKTLVGSNTVYKALTLGNSQTVSDGTILALNNYDISLLSSNSNTANVTRTPIPSANVTYGTGRFIVERFLPMQTPYSGRRWRLVGVPVTPLDAPSINTAWQEGATPTPTTSSATSTVSIYNPTPGYGTHITNGNGGSNNINGFDAGSTANPSIYKMEPGTGVWSVPGSTSTTITNYNAYMLFVRGDRSITVSTQYINTTGGDNLRIRGKINIGDTAVNIVTGKQALSNPYPSAITMNNVTYKGAAIGSDNTKTYYMWDPKLLGSKGVGAWVTFTSTGLNSYTVVPNSIDAGNMSAYGTTGKIESGGTFFINNTGSAGTIVFHESDKLTTSGIEGLASRPGENATPASNPSISSFYTNLAYIDANQTPILADGVATIYSENFNNEVDEQDAMKLQTFQTKEKISLLRNDSNLAVEKRRTIVVDDTIFLQMLKLDFNYSYQLQFVGNNFANGLTAYLIDKYLDKKYIIPTEGITRHNFTTNATTGSIDINRFKIVFKLPNGGLLPVNFSLVNAMRNNDKIIVDWKVENEINIKEYEVERSADGINFTKVNTTTATGSPGNNYSWTDLNANAGNNFYRIKSIGKDGSILYSNIVKVSYADAIAGFTVYPNPTTDGKISVNFSNADKGRYTLKLFNNIGQLLQSKSIEHAGGNSTISLQNLTAKGIYHVEINKPDNTTQTIKVMY